MTLLDSLLAAELSNVTISLWDVQEQKSIATLDGLSAEKLVFSPRNYVLASLSRGAIRLWNGSTGKFITCPDYESEEHVEFVFSRDGSRLATLTKKGKACSLTLWDGENGN